MAPIADIELNIHRQDQNTYAVDFRYSDAASQADVRLGAREQALISFDLQHLNEIFLTGDLKTYRQVLTSTFFAAESLRSAFAYARAASQQSGSALRIRLTIGANALELHPLRWELLNDPQTGSPLATDQTVYFSRYLSSQDWRPVRLRSRGELKALVVIAAPDGLDEFNIARVDKEAELATIRAGLGDSQLHILERATINSLVSALTQDEFDILYLVAHGTFARGEGHLWLEDEAGKIARIAGVELVTRLRELEHRPRLVVLASCQSAGQGAGQVLSALGPGLAEAGIPAVLAMQDNLYMDTVAKFMPLFFSELQKDGQIDRALAVARGLVREQLDWWVPALFMRLKDGRLFEGLTTRLYNLPNLPLHYLPRQDAFDSLKALVLGQTRRVGVTGAGHVGVQGMGGIGKSVLAAALVHDPEIQRAFPDGVIWLTLGQAPDVVARQIEVADFFEAEAHGFRDAQHGKAVLRRLLADKNCLLVLDDVWDLRHAEALDCLGAAGCLLLTTRDVEITNALNAARQNVDVLGFEQSLEFITQWVGQPAGSLPPEAAEVVRECGGLPLALAMAGAIARENAESWRKVLHRLRNADLAKIRQQFPDYPYPDLFKAIEVSVEALEPDWRERYLDLAVFPEDTPLSLAVLQTFWEPQGLDEFDVQDLADGLVRRSLARRDEQGRLSLHDLHHDYIRKQVVDLPTLHRRLLDAYSAVCRAKSKNPQACLWTAGPQDGYFFDHLIHHLLQAGSTDEIYQTLTSFDYLEMRLRISSVYALEADYRLALPSMQGTAHIVLEAVEARLRLEDNAIRRSPELLFPNLYNHLAWLDAPDGPIHALFEKNCQRQHNWLRCLHDPRPAPPPWLRSIEGHTNDINSVVFSPDTLLGTGGQTILSGSSDHTVKLWARETGQFLRSFDGHTDDVQAVAFLPDGNFIVSCSDDKTIRLWDKNSGQLVRTFEGHTSTVYSVAVSSSGRTLISGSGDNTLKIWDLGTGQLIRTLVGHTSRVTTVAVSLDEQIVLSGSRDRTIRLWDRNTGQILHCLEGHTAAINDAVLSPDGKQILSAANDKTIKLWDARTGQLLRTFDKTANILVFSSDGQSVLSGHSSTSPTLWDLESGETLRSYHSPAYGVVDLAFSPDGQHFIGSVFDRTIWFWAKDEADPLYSVSGHSAPISAVVFSPDGQRLLSASHDNSLRLWEASTGRLLFLLKGHKAAVNAAAFSPDGKFILSGSTDSTIKLWDGETGQLIRSLVGHTSSVRAVAFSPDGHRAISGSGDKRVIIWDCHTGQALHSLEGHTSPVYAVAFAPDGQRIISGASDQTVRLWEAETGQELRSLAGHTGRVTAVAFSADGKTISSASDDKTLRLWNADSGQLLHVLSGHTQPVNAVAFSPDGQALVSGSDDFTLRLWETQTGRFLRSFEGHPDWVKTVAFSPNGRWIASGDQKQTIKIWDRDFVPQVRSVEGHKGQVHTLAFSGDGQFVVSAANDRTIKLWEKSTGRLARTWDGYTDSVFAANFCPDGRLLLAGSQKNSIRLWDGQSHRLINLAERQGIDFFTLALVRTLAFSSDGQSLLVGSWGRPPTLLDVNTGQSVLTLEGHTDTVNCAAFSADGQTILTGSNDKTVRLWDKTTGQCLRIFENPALVDKVTSSPDGRSIAVVLANSRTLHLFDRDTGKIITDMEFDDTISALAFSPDGKNVLICSQNTLRQWNLQNGDSRALFNTTTSITSLVINGRWLACGNYLGSVWIFEWMGAE